VAGAYRASPDQDGRRIVVESTVGDGPELAFLHHLRRGGRVIDFADARFTVAHTIVPIEFAFVDEHGQCGNVKILVLYMCA
jgi:hypothetical protein